MKKIISFVLAVLMSLNICMVANAESILTGTYTFIDSAYSPELDMYVVMAKDFSSGSHNTQLYRSTDGVNWTACFSGAQGGKNYATAKTRQLLVWWEDEEMFVAMIGAKTFVSKDGITWNAATNLNCSNGVIETDGETLVMVGDRTMKIAKDASLATEDIVVGTGSRYYKAIGLYDREEIYFALDGSTYGGYASVVSGEERTLIKEKFVPKGFLGEVPLDVVYVPKLKNWLLSLDKKVTIGIIKEDYASNQNSILIITPQLENGKNTDVVTGIGVGEKYAFFGTKAGKIYYANIESMSDETTVWKEVVGLEANGEITTITSSKDGFLMALSEKEQYFLAETDNEVKVVNPKNIDIQFEIPRVEIPNDGVTYVEITPDVYNFKNEKIFDGITYFGIDNVNGINCIWNNATLNIEVTSDAEGAVNTFIATDKFGGTHEYEVTFAKETDVGLEGFASVAMPGYGEEKVEYTYKAHVLGSDGEKMDRTASMEVVDLPENVEFNTESGVLTIYDGASAGSFKIKVTSDGNAENSKEFEITIKECEPSTIEFTEGEDLIVVPDDKNGNYQYSVLIKDQVARPMPEEEIKWSLETPFEGVSISDNGMLNVDETTNKGEITVVAESVKNADLKISRKVTLDWSDLRCVKESLNTIEDDIITGENIMLVSEGENGTAFAWETSDESIVTSEGVITRNRQKNTSATLTVTCAKNDSKASKKINVTVLKADNIASIGDFEEQNIEGINGEIVTDSNNGEYALKVNKELKFDVEVNNESSYVFEAYVKGEGSVKLKTEIAGEIATVKAGNGFVRIIGNYSYRKQNKTFKDTVTISSDSDFVVDDIKVYEITLEYEEVMKAITKAEYSKKKADIDAAKKACENFLDIPLRSELEERVNKIKANTTGGGGGGSSGGGGFVTPSSTSVGTVGITGSTVNNDEKVYEHLLIFKDLSKHWAKDDVEYMANLGIVSGVSETQFNPDANITRAEFAKLIVKTVGLDETLYENTYYDVVSEDWYSGYVQAAKNAGYISGYNGMFRPNDQITREEMAKVIVAAYNQKANKKMEQGGALYFTDIENISGWAYDYIVTATREGFINGVTEEKFAPKENATRAQAVVMLKRLYNKLNAE